MSDITAIDDTGEFVFSLIHINKQVTYNANGSLATMTAGPDTRGNLYVQTYIYTDGAMSGLSTWVKK
jgi:hypothetical protein